VVFDFFFYSTTSIITTIPFLKRHLSRDVRRAVAHGIRRRVGPRVPRVLHQVSKHGDVHRNRATAVDHARGLRKEAPPRRRHIGSVLRPLCGVSDD